MKKGRFSFKVFFIALAIIYVSVILGNLLVIDSLQSGWYHSIRPAITPPDQVFQIVWTVIYFLIAGSFTLFYRGSNKKDRTSVISVFVINIILNMVWSLIFFGQKLIGLALFDMTLTGLSIVYLMCLLWKNNRTSALLLIPYLLWISFQWVINYLCLGNL
ncbi:MAG: TspO/MBR family protein [archaeon]